MNILVLTSEYPYEKYPKPDWTWVVPYFCREWVKQGHNVIVFNNASAFPQIYYSIARLFCKEIANYYDISEKGLEETRWTKKFAFKDQGVEIYNLPMHKLIPGGGYSNRVFGNQINRIVKILQNKNFLPDIITGHWLNPQLRLIYELKKFYYNSKTAIVFHGDYSKDNCKRHKVHKYIGIVDHVGCRSKSAQESILNYLTVREAFICPSGVPDEYIPDNIERKKFHQKNIQIFSAGRLIKYKNFDVIITAACKAFGDKKFVLNIAGEGPLKEKLSNIIKACSRSNECRLVGRLSRDAVQEKMKEADIFVLISRQETFGLVYLEAMLQGCIVVASKGGGVDGIIIDGKNGFLCREGDEDDLEKVFRKIDNLDTKLKEKISRNAIMTAKEYTNSKVAERYLKKIMQ